MREQELPTSDGGYAASYNIMLDNGYRIVKLNNLDPSFFNDYPDINDKGWVAWSGQDGSFEGIAGHDIFLYNGRDVRQLTNNDYIDYYPKINNNGWVVWGGSDERWGPNGENGDEYEIYLYDGKKIRQVTDNNYNDGSYQINNNGWVVWQAILSDDDREIFLYDGEKTTRITENDYSNRQPMINDQGWVTWIQYAPNETTKAYEIMLYDGSETVQLSGDGHLSIGENFAPQINEKGWVTWGGADPKSDQQYNPETDQEIFLYDGSTTIQLTDNSTDDQEPQINDDGWVVWSGWDGHDSEIFLYDGTEVIQLTDNGYNDKRPQMNNLGWDIEAVRNIAAPTSRDRNSMGPMMIQPSDSPGDTEKPRVSLSAPFVSTRISKTTTFKVKWSATDPSPLAWQSRKNGGSSIAQVGGSGIKSYTVRYRPSTSRTWRTWKKDVKATQAYFTGKAGVTYYFRVRAEDKAGNYGWSKVRKTTIPFNEGMSRIRTIGFNGYLKNSKSPVFLSSVRYSYTRGNTLVYKLYNNNGIGLVTTKGPNRGRAKIYVDGKYVKTIDAYKSSLRPRQLIFYRGFRKKGTHWLKIVNLGTPGRARFDVDGIVVAR